MPCFAAAKHHHGDPSCGASIRVYLTITHEQACRACGSERKADENASAWQGNQSGQQPRSSALKSKHPSGLALQKPPENGVVPTLACAMPPSWSCCSGARHAKYGKAESPDPPTSTTPQALQDKEPGQPSERVPGHLDVLPPSN